MLHSRYIILVLIALGVSLADEQDKLRVWPFSRKDSTGVEKWGLVRGLGDTVVRAKYAEILDSCSGGFPVKKNYKNESKWSFLDTNGKLITKFPYKEVRCPNEGIYPYRYHKTWGFFQRDSKAKIIPLKLPSKVSKINEAESFRFGRAVVKSGKKWHLIDAFGKSYPLPEFTSLDVVDSNRFLLGQKKGKHTLFGIVDSLGKWVIPMQKDSLFRIQENLWASRISEDSVKVFRLIRRKYSARNGSHYRVYKNVYQMGNLKEHYITEWKQLKNGVKWRWRNLSSPKSKRPFVFDEVKLLGNGMVAALKNGNWKLYYASTGRRAGNRKYEAVLSCNEKLCTAQKDGFWGAVAINGKIKIPFRLDSLGEFNDGAAVFRSGLQYGLMSKRGKEILPAVSPEIISLDYGYWSVRGGEEELGLSAVFNSKGDTLTPFSIMFFQTSFDDKLTAIASVAPHILVAEGLLDESALAGDYPQLSCEVTPFGQILRYLPEWPEGQECWEDYYHKVHCSEFVH